MRNRYLILIIIMLVSFELNSQENDVELPEAPPGFTWNHFEEIKGYFLIPDNWFVNSEKKENTFAYFITKEDLKKEGLYETGISINVITKLKKINSLEYIEKFKDEIKKDVEVLKESDLIEVGPFRQFIILFKTFSEKSKKNIMVHQVLISNIKTNTMYIIMFESPENEWETNFGIAEKILSLFSIDDEI